jgi:hypothetical protein
MAMSSLDITKSYNQISLPNVLGGFSSASFATSSFAPPPPVNFNESPYIRGLNHALELEQAAVSLYTAKQRLSLRDGRPGASAIDRTSAHFHALRQLVRLIFAHRGIPCSDPSGFLAVTGAVAARVSRYMPPIVQDPMLGASAHRVELALARRYRRLLELAPVSDRPLLESLLSQLES